MAPHPPATLSDSSGQPTHCRYYSSTPTPTPASQYIQNYPAVVPNSLPPNLHYSRHPQQLVASQATERTQPEVVMNLKALRKPVLLAIAEELKLDVSDSPNRTNLIKRIVGTGTSDEGLSEYVESIQQRKEAEEAERIRIHEATIRALYEDIARMNRITRAQHRKRLLSCICAVCIEPERCSEVANMVQSEVTEKAAVCEVPPEKGTRLYQCDMQSDPSAERNEKQVVVREIAPRKVRDSPRIGELETILEPQQGNYFLDVEREDIEGSPKCSEHITLLELYSTASEGELLLKVFPTDSVGNASEGEKVHCEAVVGVQTGASSVEDRFEEKSNPNSMNRDCGLLATCLVQRRVNERPDGKNYPDIEQDATF
ncbi:hypothetical protein HPB51_013353 [Rhipicephalus microplus]|uniref:Uncharacterized protein n=1 Tax=Rhipicephalus microplus TaxID=6941 RepID=A0A9J6EGI1_RHIMP|nr:hypothetical protein HPB51_013353 [Rhipicephalus microplus]